MKKYVIITASGKGLRMNSDIPKQFIEIAGKPIIMHTIEKFYNYNKQINIIVTLNSQMLDYWNELIKKYKFKISHKIVIGGKTRFHSIKNAITKIEENSITAVHDAVRPLVSLNTIVRCFKKAEECGNAVPFININESIREINGTLNKIAIRDNFVLIQTPQVFMSDILIKAYKQEFSENFTDDASVAENIGQNINLIEGNYENIKITKPLDLKIAEMQMYKYTSN